MAKPNRTTKPINVQADPSLVDALRAFAAQRSQSIRVVVEQALRRHLANPPPELDLPPLPPVPVRKSK